MKEASKIAFRVLAAAYPKWLANFTAPEMINTWRELVDDVDGDKLVAAAKRLAMTSQWPPSVAELRQAAGAPPPKPPPQVYEVDW